MHSAQHQQSSGISRRQFLRALGIGTAALGTSLVLPGQAQERFVLSEDTFGRMFPRLPSFFEHVSGRQLPELQRVMKEIGKLGGMMDAKDDLSAGPIRLITDPGLNLINRNNPAHTAGTTFMGQFLDHDMTFDLTSKLGVPTDPEDSVNTRTPALDLDSVYGGGPSASPELYELRRGPAPKFKIESGGRFEDVPRDRKQQAIIADPRNDENLIISGLQAAFLLFHNHAVDYVADRDKRASSDNVFREARRLTSWHYQWMIVHEFLPLFIGQELVKDILDKGRKIYQPREAFIPVEFQGAVYRFGHTLVRPSYRANLKGDKGELPFFAMIFDDAGEGQDDPIDLRGGARAPRRFVGWQTFFDFGLLENDGISPAVKPNKRIDTKISTPLFKLPVGAIAGGVSQGEPVSLPSRNLLRHITWSLPSGQSIARVLGVPVLSKEQLKDLKQFDFGLDESTPLWFYALREGDLMADGAHLGPVGGRIVGEVFIGLLQLDQRSYLAARPPWKPTLPDRNGKVTGNFTMLDFLTFAGVAPAQRGQ